MTVRLKYVTAETLPSGNVRYRLRKTGLKALTLYSEPNSDDFMRDYHAWLNGEFQERAVDRAKKKMHPHSIAMLVTVYRASPNFTSMAQSSQRTYGRVLDKMVDEHGEMDVRLMRPRHVRKMRDKIEGATAANRFVSILRVICSLACEMDWMDQNPCTDVAKRKHKTTGFHSWTDAEIAQFMEYWPEGTMQRLAMMLLLDTGQRSSDVCKMGRLRNGAIQVKQKKTGASLELYLQPETIAEIHRHPLSMVFVRTSFGKAFTVKGFQKWFSQACTDAGLPHCSSHGLRKARARMIAERGGTTEQIKSITGHTTDAEVNRYVRAASQKRLARGVSDTIGRLDLSTPKNVGKKGEKR